MIQQKLSHIHAYLRQELSLRLIILALALGVLFVIVVAATPNFRMLAHAITSPNLSFFSLLFSFGVESIFTSMPLYGAVMLFGIGFLTGVNVVLIAKRSVRLRQAGAVGIGSMFGALLGGCAACATGILPLLGLAGVFAILPFHGSEFAVIAIIILIATIYWNAHAEVCRAPLKK